MPPRRGRSHGSTGARYDAVDNRENRAASGRITHSKLDRAESPYILASRQNPQTAISNNTLLFALYRLGYKNKMTGHGFRAVASTVLNESKLWGRDAIERQLAHRETDQVREAYHRAEYLDERRRMMAWWSGYLDESRSRTQA